MSLVIVCWNPGVPTNISHEFYPYLLKSRCAYQHFPCLFTLSAEILLCLPTFVMSLIIACCNPCVPTNISHVSNDCLLKSGCAYQHFPWILPLSAEIQVCLPTFPMSLIIVCCNPGVPTNIFHEFYHYMLKTRCAYQHSTWLYHCLLKSWCAYRHFPWILPLSAEIQVCLPTFPKNFTLICWNFGVRTNICHVSNHCLL